jgi:hypothetical protein
MDKQKKIKGTICRNCQADLNRDENYCPNCGQKNDIRRLAVGEFISESLGNFFSFDSKIIQSLIPFFMKPGVLSRKYVDGEKVRFVMPFRMYMFFSVIFFLVAGYYNPINKMEGEERIDLPKSMFERDDDFARIDSIVSQTDVTEDSEVDTSSFPILDAMKYARENPDSSAVMALKELGQRPSDVNIKKYNLWTKFLRMNQMEFVQSLLDKLPFIVFLFMPFLACAMKFYYIRNDIYYSEHLTFLLQSNSMLFLLATIVILAQQIIGVELGVWAWLFYSIYFLIAMKNFYKQGWIKTLLKYILVGWSYVILFPIFGILSVLFVYYFF